MSKRVSDQVVQIADRLDRLLVKIKGVLPKSILDEDTIIKGMFGDEGASPQKSLVMTYLRIEPLIRFCEQELVPAVEEETAKKTTEKAEASDATVSH